jgi:microcystin-dependent protein
MEAFIGMLSVTGFDFAPAGWAFCHGQLLAISDHTAVFALLGTTYGGDGHQTFGLPDLRGRAPIGFGHGPGLQQYGLGQSGGSETVTLTPNQIPAHNHNVPTAATAANAPAGNVLTTGPLSPGQPHSSATTSATGGNQPHNNMPPYLAVNWVICLQGIFPSRP